VTDVVIDYDPDTAVRRIWATVPGQGVAYSADSGTTLTIHSTGLASLDLTSLELEVVGAVRRIWATTRGGDGVVYSDDLGQTWKSAAGTGLTSRDVNDFTYESSAVRRIWGTVRRIWATTDAGVFYSDNDGLSWTELSLGLPSGVPVTSVSIDPNTNEVMVSLFSDREGGAYRGANLTGVWTPFNDGLEELKVQRLTNDGGRVLDATTKATTFYAATAGDGAYRTELRTVATTTLRITTGAMPEGALRRAYSQKLIAAGGTSPYRWSVQKGSLPPGLSLEASGLVSGSPTVLGSYRFTVQVADQAARVDERELTLAVVVPFLSIGDVSVTEGDAGTRTATFTVGLSAASAQTVTVDYATADGSATAGSDYVATSGTLTFPSGSTTQSFPVTVSGDTVVEPDETFVVNLSGSAHATIADGQGTATINDDEGSSASRISIDDRAVSEGSATTASFRVTLDAPSSQTITVHYATANGTATAPSDYTATSGTLTLSPGRTTHSIAVPIVTDSTPEGTETFTVNLSGATNAIVGRSQATGSIGDPPEAAIVPMYRAYNFSADYHFFTTSLGEKDNAVANGYRDESTPVPFNVPNTGATGASAIFRMYNPNSGRHYYTAGAGERDSLKGVGWVYEKDEGFIYVALQTGTAEVFRLYNHNSGVHLYTANAGEKDAILAAFPGIWVQHTSLGFAVP
jgi:hypothetical protein